MSSFFSHLIGWEDELVDESLRGSIEGLTLIGSSPGKTTVSKRAASSFCRLLNECLRRSSGPSRPGHRGL